jgi:hypothetical protein
MLLEDYEVLGNLETNLSQRIYFFCFVMLSYDEFWEKLIPAYPITK